MDRYINSCFNSNVSMVDKIMIILSLFIFIVAGVVGIVHKYTAPKCDVVFDLIGIA